ncbi:recombinase family protein [Photobacterium leiognathi]|uniref:recombinase family protein n=1 Tax=Photobacterium leiognathi TaxID=553611 RepID=UPI0029818F5C|nr:recombinase family protein [Photobacterium leiognathi]
MTTVLFYTRYSSSKQQKGSSIQRQVKLCDSYRINNKLPSPNKHYSDKGTSAYHSKQLEGELGELLHDLENATYQKPIVVLCEAIDRISRASIRDSQTIINRITEHADLITVCDSKVYTHSDDSLETSLIQLVKTATSREESDKKSARAKEFWNKCKEEGKAQNSVCPKYLKLNLDRRSYTVKSDIADEIKGIYKLLKAGQGIKKVHQSFPSWSPSSIARLRKDRRIVEYGIISDTDFWKVQSTLKTTRKCGAKNSKNLFRSLFVCGECGSNLVYVAPRPSRPTWSGHLMCKNRQSKGRGSCPNSKNINYNRFEPILLDFLESVSSDLFKSNLVEVEAKKAQLEATMMKHEQLEKKLDNLYDILGEAPTKRGKAKIDQVEIQLNELEETKEKLSAEVQGYTDIQLERPTTDLEREEFNTQLLHAFKSITVKYPTEDNQWFTFDDKFEISSDFTRWELIHDDTEELPIELEF